MDGVDLLLRGGPMMVPLLFCAVLSIAVMIERYLFLANAANAGDDLAAHVRVLLESGRDDEALRLATAASGPVARLVAEAIRNRNIEPKLVEQRLQELALLETPKLSKRLNILDTIITISPLLGLLGTVTGMIRAFHVVGDPSAMNGPAAITGGVAEALIATATGLAIAIVTLVAYNGLGERVKTIVSSMELAATQVLNILTARSHSVAPPPVPDGHREYEAAPTRA